MTCGYVQMYITARLITGFWGDGFGGLTGEPPFRCRDGLMSCGLIRLSALLDDGKCFELIRRQRWPDGVRCPSCASARVVRNGWEDARRRRQRWLCKGCRARFD